MRLRGFRRPHNDRPPNDPDVWVTCPNCGDLQLTVRDVQVQEGGGFYAFVFTCPVCGLWVHRQMSQFQRNQLVDAGATRVVCEVTEPVSMQYSSITAQDFRDLREGLKSDDWMRELLQ